MDNTLYDNPLYAEHQERVLVEALAHHRGVDVDQQQKDLDEYREQVHRKTGARPSLGNSFVSFGASIALSVEWRNRHIRPELFLRPDRQLSACLEELQSRFTLFVVTNNPGQVARRTLACLGVEQYFTGIQGLDDSGVSKPDPDIFRRAAARAGVEPGYCLSIGDRFSVDIEPALSAGMWGLLVESVTEVYELGALLH